MSTLQERIEELMRDSELKTPSMVAAAAKVTVSAVSQWLGNGGKVIHAIGKVEAAINLERATGYSWLWLAKGTGPKRVPERAPSAPPWPFPEIDLQKLVKLSERQLGHLEQLILEGAQKMGVEIASGESFDGSGNSRSEGKRAA